MAESNIVSLMNTLQLTLRSHRFHSIHVKQQIITLYRKVRILQKLLQDFPENRLLEIRIRDSAYAIEDVVETTIIEQIILNLPSFMANSASENTSGLQDHSLEEAIEEIDSIVEELLQGRCGLKGLLPRKGLQVGPSRSSRNAGSTKRMVGVDEDALQLKDRLTGQESKLQIIPIVGMGGIGKTTLTRNLFHDSLIDYYFDVRAWVTISQTYTKRDVLQSLLKGIGVSNGEQSGGISVLELALILFRNLKGRRYLIVLDDVWNSDVWDDFKRVFPDDANGSRVMLTTRLVEVAVYSTDSSSHPHHMKLLEEDKSWELFCGEAFGNQDCPSELEDIGKVIVRNCRGLPLATSVIGRLLANSSMTRDFWEYVAQNVNSIAINSDEHCHEILSLSYHNLPPHLKPCFLYFGIFPEDHKIPVTKLIKLWIAEGFLKPIRSKSLERAAREYLEDLIDRNLVFVHEKGSNGETTRTCIIHDLLRDLCVKEAQKENFPHIINGLSEDVPMRRIIKHGVFPEDDKINGFDATFQSTMSLYSLLQTGRFLSAFKLHRRFILLRVLDILGVSPEIPFEIQLLVNLRYLAFSIEELSNISPHISLLWKLQFLIVHEYENWILTHDKSSEILQMTHLRHLQIIDYFQLRHPIDGNNTCLVLKDMESLSTVVDFRCTEEFLKKFPSLRKLGVFYNAANIHDWSDYHLQNLVHLSRLENLKCSFDSRPNHYKLPDLVFPQSLRKLTLSGSRLFRRDMTVIGTLPHLEVLKLRNMAFVGKQWEPNEGEFRRLKFLLIEKVDLEEWVTEDTHFPCLEHLIVRRCFSLREIPSGIGEIATMKTIEIECCSHSAATSAEQILEEQRSLENHVLQVQVTRNRWERS